MSVGVALGVLLVSGLAACSSPAETPAEVNLHVESDMWSYQEQSTLECMEAAGFEYVTRAAPPSSGQQVAQSPYSLTRSQAEAHGFGYVENAVKGSDSTSALDANASYRTSLSAEEQVAYDHTLEGDPSGESTGCRAEAQDLAYSRYGSELQSVLGSTDSLEEVLADPRYTQFEAEWAACMGTAGYKTTGFEDFHRGLVVKATSVSVITEDSNGEVTVTVSSADAEAALAEEVRAANANLDCLDPLENDFNELIDDVVG